jgi:hypothetical protein
MVRSSLRWIVLAVTLFSVPLSMQRQEARAVAPANTFFYNTWARTDLPVAGNQVSRTWMWGPDAFTDALHEEYAEAPGAQRVVQYFDKSRMEITYPGAPQDTPWYVTNGLLVVELVSGRMQTGDNTFVPREPADVNIAGDPGSGPSYADLAELLDAPAALDNEPIIQRLNEDGSVSVDPLLALNGVVAAYHVTEGHIDHQVASPFWEFANSSGLVYEHGGYANEHLFEPWFYATGLPITEAYWTNVAVGGTPRMVLFQCFERRCLTYTPDNPEGWKVEAGNVGQHYHAWRYPVQQEVERLFVAHLSGQAVVSSVASSASGLAIFCLSDDGDSLFVQVRVHDIVNALELHLHTGQPGETGAIIYTLWFTEGEPYTGSGILFEDELTDADLPASTSLRDLIDGFTAGNLYVDIHTADHHEEGELRGQVAVADELVLPATLDPRQVPGDAVSSFGSGSASFRYDHETHSISYRVTIADTPNTTAAHIHLAQAGATGPVVAPLQTPTNSSPAKGTLTADNLTNDLAGLSIEQLVCEMLRGNTYVNVHTEAHPGGEIRGQVLTPAIQQTLTAAGGVVSLPGQITLTFPAGALPLDTIVTITIEPPPDIPGTQGIAVANTWTIDLQAATTLQPLQPVQPVDIEAHYDESDVPYGLDEQNIYLAFFDESEDAWTSISSEVHPSSDTVTGSPSHLSRWSLVL